MSEGPADPFDKTRILPGVPELPAEATRILPLSQPRPELELEPVALQAAAGPPRRQPARAGALIVWTTAGAVLTAGISWWLFRGEGHAPGRPADAEPVGDSLPPSLQGYRDAAERGDAKAMRMLGACYTYGLGVRVNPVEGASWYRRAAKAGDAVAAQELQAAQARR